MTDEINDGEAIHLGELDEYLASKILDSDFRPLAFSVSKLDTQGNIAITHEETNKRIEEGGIDFELSPSEYQSLNSVVIQDFTIQTVYTSSAYELFDFLFMYFSKLKFIADFSENSWMVKILDATNEKK